MVDSQPNDPIQVLIEMRVDASESDAMGMAASAGFSEVSGFKLDTDYEPVPMEQSSDNSLALSANEKVVLVRGSIATSDIEKLEARPNVVKVWKDTQIEPFRKRSRSLELTQATAACPISPCDCSPGTAKGTIASVAKFLGVKQIWDCGIKGQGIVIGIVDGGITAKGRVSGGTIPNVIGGWPTSDWGKIADWSGHGNMTGTDTLGMAPEANLYDFRIATSSLSGVISNAIQSFQWAINQHKKDGTPQILSNSWGIFQKAWDPDYATNPNHPFTRKVVEAINEGIIVLFAAGNCGATCPDGRCGNNTGPGKDIWGANGHPRVLTIGAVNQKSQYIGYSSAGPAALDPKKPDFCGVSHFKGFFSSDSGTSAACPIVAGVTALLAQIKSDLDADTAKQALKTTAVQIGAGSGWNQYSGYGRIDALAAFQQLQDENWLESMLPALVD